MHMRKTPVSGRLNVKRAVAACRGWLSGSASAAVTEALILAGYPPWPIRRPVPKVDLVRRRGAHQEQSTKEDRQGNIKLIERLKGKYDRYTTGEKHEPPVLDVLIISGGGDWGAFGAGFLGSSGFRVGW